MKIKRTSAALGTLFILGILTVGFAYAAFTDQSKFTGSRFSVGSADIKLLNDLAGGTDVSNLVDTKPAPSYDGVYPQWSQDYLVKIYNNGSQPLNLTSRMDYATANDPANIREYLYMEPYAWDDVNNNGIVDEGEQGVSYGRRVFTSWKSTGFNFGQIGVGEVRGFIMRFSAASNLPDSKQGATGVFDFMFNSEGI